MKFRKYISKVGLLTILIGMISCGGGETQNEDNAADEFSAAQSELQNKITTVIKEMPPPSEIPFLLEATGADYNEVLINDIEKADSYRSTSHNAALNLGIYAADIGYLSSYDKTQEALNFLTKSKDLADYLGVTGAFDLQLIQRFEDNLGTRDSLAAIIDESIGNTNKYLQGDDRTKVAVLVLAGSFVEGLYISTGLVNSYPKDLLPDDARSLILTPVIRLVLEQEKPLADLITMLASLGEDVQIKGLIDDLEQLKTSYEELNIQEQISQNRADLLLTDETLTDITSKVNQIRTGITG